MKKVMVAFVMAMMAFAVNVQAEEAVQDAKAAQFAQEIAQLKQDLAIKEAEYNEYIKGLDLQNAKSDVKLRGGSASQCSYQCNLYHRDDYYMWSQCFNACVD